MQAFSSLLKTFCNESWIAEQAILTTRKEPLPLLNILVESFILGSTKLFLSADSVEKADATELLYSADLPNSLLSLWYCITSRSLPTFEARVHGYVADKASSNKWLCQWNVIFFRVNVGYRSLSTHCQRKPQGKAPLPSTRPLHFWRW